jgi:alkylhydroperoxidase/carboxymuconolactone decarboxylase family protein YurZ
MKRSTILSLAFAITLGTFAAVQAQEEAPAPGDAPGFVDENGDGINDNRPHRGRGFRGHRGIGRLGADLSDEQKAAVKETAEALKADGATREDIRAAITDQLTGFGIEVPTQEEIEAQRTEHQAQRQEVRVIVDGLKEEGATRDEIKAAVDQYRTDNGIEAPVGGNRGGKRGGKRGRGIGGHGGRGGFGPRGGGAGNGADAPADTGNEAQ